MADVHSQNTALKKDMADMLSIVSKLREENETYRQNFENLRAAHMTLQQQAQVLGTQASDATESARVSALNHEQLLRSLKSQLEAKSREFEDMRERMLPTRELDIIRIRIAEEMDAPHRQHTAALEAEIAQFRSMYYSLRRDHELFKAKHEALQGESREALQEAAVKYEAEQQQQGNDDKADSARHKNLVREVTELQQRLRQALIEIEDTRAEANKYKVEVTQRARTHARQIADIEGGSRSMMAEKGALEAKCTGLERLTSDLQRQNRMLSDQVNQLELNKCDLRAQMDDSLAEYRRQLEDLKRTIEETESFGKREKEALTRELTESNKQLTEARQREKELSAQLGTLTKDFALKMKKAREDDTSNARVSEQARHSLEERLTADERGHLVQLARLEAACRDKGSLIAQSSIALKAAEAELATVSSHARTLQVALTSTEAELAASARLLAQRSDDHNDLQRRLSAADHREQVLRETVDKLTNDVGEMQANMDTSVRRAVSDASIKYQTALDQDAEKTRKIRTGAKRMRRYKSEYIQLRALHERVTSSMQHQIDILTAKLDRVSLEKQAHNHSLGAEITKLRSQINNKIREQTELEMKSQMTPETTSSLLLTPLGSRPALSHSLPLELHLLDQQDRLTHAELLSMNSRISVCSNPSLHEKLIEIDLMVEDISTLQQYQKGSMDAIFSPTTLMDLNHL